MIVGDVGGTFVELPVDERQLIRQLVAGHAAAWSEFVSRHQGLVVSTVRNTALQCQFQLSAVELEDICAEVYASLIVNDFRSLRQFRYQCRVSTWLAVIARRVCLGQLSRLRRARQGLQPALRPETRAGQGDVLSRMIRAEQHDEIQTSIQRLNDKDRLLLDLYFHQQLSYAEIGEQAGISANSVGPKVSRALGRLRKMMGRV